MRGAYASCTYRRLGASERDGVSVSLIRRSACVLLRFSARDLARSPRWLFSTPTGYSALCRLGTGITARGKVCIPSDTPWCRHLSSVLLIASSILAFHCSRVSSTSRVSLPFVLTFLPASVATLTARLSIHMVFSTCAKSNTRCLASPPSSRPVASGLFVGDRPVVPTACAEIVSRGGKKRKGDDATDCR